MAICFLKGRDIKRTHKTFSIYRQYIFLQIGFVFVNQLICSSGCSISTNMIETCGTRHSVIILFFNMIVTRTKSPHTWNTPQSTYRVHWLFQISSSQKNKKNRMLGKMFSFSTRWREQTVRNTQDRNVSISY